MKKIFSFLLILLSFFFIKNNVFADTVTCKYSLGNLNKKVVSLDDYGVPYFVGGSTSTTAASSDKLVMTITDPESSNFTNMASYLKFSVEGSSFSIKSPSSYEEAAYGNNFSIYNYTLNGSKYEALQRFKKCPDIAILYNQSGSSSNYVITNISGFTSGDNIKDLFSVYKEGITCKTTGVFRCYYGAPENDYQSDKIGAMYEVYPEKGTIGIFTLKDTMGSTVEYPVNEDQRKETIRPEDFKCSTSGYTCPANTYYLEASETNKIWPITYAFDRGAFDLKTLEFIGLYTVHSANFSTLSISGEGDRNEEKTVEKAQVFHFCADKGVLKTLKIVGVLIDITKIVIPVLLIILGSIEYGKAAISDDSDALEKTTEKLIKKVVVAVLIFAIPTAVNAIISLGQSDKDVSDQKNTFHKCAACFAGNSVCDAYIDSAK